MDVETHFEKLEKEGKLPDAASECPKQHNSKATYREG